MSRGTNRKVATNETTADAVTDLVPMDALLESDSSLPVYGCSEESLRIENTWFPGRGTVAPYAQAYRP
jgi:hypothetical protein